MKATGGEKMASYITGTRTQFAGSSMKVSVENGSNRKRHAHHCTITHTHTFPFCSDRCRGSRCMLVFLLKNPALFSPSPPPLPPLPLILLAAGEKLICSSVHRGSYMDYGLRACSPLSSRGQRAAGQQFHASSCEPGPQRTGRRTSVGPGSRS